ncbi:ABC transporter F family member 4 isoform X2 [Manihot esculenta]|uniref:Uncharacterized protein n=2 Tax=Manihot esculenta TaxID=3983 RepID=A0ACB7GAU4_MANES|nr:ABC transporter F family member 4 isoform X2 [Manihot esculenta]KAG8636944.1 hypothetical protein MANES_15G060500v8 [Manihot esculenta]OAY28357.1 hypothetical protein MANES_15G060500v8 [Manihot esculenta]
MGKEETATEIPEVVENGTNALEKCSKVVTEKKEKESSELKSMDEDKVDSEKAETEKMDEDPKVNEEKESKEEKEKEDEEKGNEEPITEVEEEKTELIKEETGSKGDAEVEGNEESKELEEKVDRSEEKEEKTEQNEDKGVKKRGRGRSSGEKKVVREKGEKKEPEPRTPASDRPQRERKSVERLVASIERDATKEFHIEKGRGTPLKDIPNVAFKLSRRKTDDTFKLLHSILFGRRGKAILIKSNISRFSGFAWHENEEKPKMRVKEKFDKCNKEKLLEFCDLLDIPVAKATTKKEDIVTKLIDFLLAPHATTAVLLAEKEKATKSKKRKRGTKTSASGSVSSTSSAKSRKKAEDASKYDKKDTSDTEESEEEKEEEEEEEIKEENDNGLPEKSDAEMPEHSENESEEESEEDVDKHKRSSRTSRKKESTGKAKTRNLTISIKCSPPPKASPKKSSSKHAEVDDDSDGTPKISSRKKKNDKVAKEKSSTPKKYPSKEKAGRRTAKGNEKAEVKEDKLKPTDDELRDAICEILKEVDFNTATFTDILKQLARRFDTDLSLRKSSVKLMIQEELTKLADDEDGDDDAEKDENQPTGQEVEA